MDTLTAAILVVSTTAAQDSSADKTAPLLRHVLEAQQWHVAHEAITPDSVPAIQRTLLAWTDSATPPGLIVTTGGTGFAVSDMTPEAAGLVHAMLASSLAITPFAAMSRPVAGVRNKSVVVTLPGSPKGAKENLESIVKMLPHACVQAAGADSRSLHSGGVDKLEAEAGIAAPALHSHAHGHDGTQHDGHAHVVRHSMPPAQTLSNDPTQGPSHRHRTSPYPMLSVSDALDLIAQFTPDPEIVTRSVDQDLVGSVLAETVTATENVPAFCASTVDGYAVVVDAPDASFSGVFPVSSVSHAAPGEAQPLIKGHVARITTGAPLPPGATAVVLVENTAIKSTTDDGTEERLVEIQAQGVCPGDNVRAVGSDIARGALLLQKGELVSGVGGEIGLLAATGTAHVEVYRRPVIGVLSTGDEIVPHTQPGPLRLGQVRDTNRPTLVSAAAERGFRVVDLGIAADRPGALEETLRKGLRQVDVLVTTGGVSMGELDLLKPTIERALGGSIHFGRVAMKPGKPTTFATLSLKDDAGRHVVKPVFSLPGNPASALVTFHLFVLAALHKMSGLQPLGLPKVPVVLGHDFVMDPRPEYHRALVAVGRDGRLVAHSTGGQRSSRVGSLRAANALVCVPGGQGKAPKGTSLDALLINTIASIV
ncbi:hypothetical protein CDD81_4219 [Ophiocordyceps australis]|uniref:MoaB/Mog domain-containing protein n=1 Tax=Ophiocordyceps australis TaxID=1399860 RepID=A0A2C5XJ86_9HYPO|nr:hypothetical protein CDD81_4219 [Ophiocordyceps australis]